MSYSTPDLLRFQGNYALPYADDRIEFATRLRQARVVLERALPGFSLTYRKVNGKYYYYLCHPDGVLLSIRPQDCEYYLRRIHEGILLTAIDELITKVENL